MDCTNCGQVSSVTEYTLHFSHEGGRELKLSLCESCLVTLLSDPQITKVEDH